MKFYQHVTDKSRLELSRLFATHIQFRKRFKEGSLARWITEMIHVWIEPALTDTDYGIAIPQIHFVDIMGSRLSVSWATPHCLAELVVTDTRAQVAFYQYPPTTPESLTLWKCDRDRVRYLSDKVFDEPVDADGIIQRYFVSMRSLRDFIEIMERVDAIYQDLFVTKSTTN